MATVARELSSRLRRPHLVPLLAMTTALILAVPATPAFAAAPTGTVTGKVVSAATGRALPEANITLWSKNSPSGGPSPIRATQAKSDGTYALNLTGILPGTYSVEAAPPWDQGQSLASTLVSLSGTVSAKSKAHQDFALPLPGKIAGHVTPTSDAGQGTYIKLFATGSNKADDGNQLWLNADGTYGSYRGIAPGTYKVQFLAPQGSALANRFYGGSFDAASAKTVSVVAGKTTSGIDGTLIDGGSVTGTVTAADTHNALADVAVELRSTDTSASNVYSYWGSDYTSRTSADGKFAFTGVAPGTYTVHFETQLTDQYATDNTDSAAAQYVAQYLGSRFVSTATTVTVTAQSAATADVALAKGARLTGTLTASKTSRFDVRAYTLDPATSKWVPVASKPVRQPGTAKSTTYSIPGLAPGSYKVGYRDYSTTATLPDAYYKDKTTLSSGTTIPVRGSTTTTKIDQTLRYRFLTIGTPAISGTTKVGSTVTAKVGTWSPTPTAYKYHWKRSGVAISKATGSKYKLTKTDKGKAITVTVTGSRSSYTSESRTSKPITAR